MKTRNQISKQETNKQGNRYINKCEDQKTRKKDTANEQGNQKPTCEMNKLETQLANVLICFFVLFFRVIPACAFSSMLKTNT